MWSATAIRPPSGSVTRVREDGTQITCVAAQTPPSYPMRSTGRNLRSWPHPERLHGLDLRFGTGIAMHIGCGHCLDRHGIGNDIRHRGASKPRLRAHQPSHQFRKSDSPYIAARASLITRQGACSLMPINELAAPWRKRERAPSRRGGRGAPRKAQRRDKADGFSVARKLDDIGRGPK